MCETATAAHGGSEDRTLWPFDRLTNDTNNGFISGRLVETLPDRDRIVIEAINDPDNTVRVDVSKCKIREALFEEDIELVSLTAIETIDLDMFLNVWASEETVATVYTHDAPLDEQRIVPRRSKDDPSYEMVERGFKRAG